MKYEYEQLNWGAKNKPAGPKHGSPPRCCYFGFCISHIQGKASYRFWSLNIIYCGWFGAAIGCLDDCGSTASLRGCCAKTDCMRGMAGGSGGRGEGVVWHSQLNNWVRLRWWRSSAHHWVSVVYCSALSATLLPLLTCSPFLFFSPPLSAIHPVRYTPVSSSRGMMV